MIKEIDEKQFEQVIDNKTPSVVIFEKPQCVHCMKTIIGIKENIEKFEDKAEFYSINILSAKALLDKYQIQAAPTILFFKDGELVKRRSGYTHPLIIEETVGGL